VSITQVYLKWVANGRCRKPVEQWWEGPQYCAGPEKGTAQYYMKEVVTLQRVMVRLTKMKCHRVAVKSFVQGVVLNPCTKCTKL
jgi:hypothetical protein